jgi:hypothetical protein
MKNDSYEGYTEKSYSHFILCKFFSENCAIFEIICKNVVPPDRQQMAMFECGKMLYRQTGSRWQSSNVENCCMARQAADGKVRMWKIVEWPDRSQMAKFECGKMLYGQTGRRWQSSNVEKCCMARQAADGKVRMWKNIVRPDRPQMAKFGKCAFIYG